MEPHKKASILYTISGLLWIGIAGGGAYAILIGLSIPTVVEDFNNKLLLYTGSFIFFGYHIMTGSINCAINRFKKTRLHWHLRKVKP
ncbi:MAG: hypothetical protein DRR04_05305 [Gammaproteobacteria bacterium]|nr:MAG: hypothetical protein DRQ97_06765 [Gammaproteobacteria bacterium]RLA60545.1 MAG: hypothetical protein DRR04_05305 [Gammaproteobacteria bacterium]